MIVSTLQLAEQLIAQPSVTPDDADCQIILAQLLQTAGFSVSHMPQGKVNNLWARYGNATPLLVFAGHTDVVPTGDLSAWRFAPFTPTIHEEYLYGRGAADMKGSVAAMIVAVLNFIKEHPQFAGSIGFLITSGEEGDDFHHGTPYVMEQLTQQHIQLDYCIVGEPSSSERLGDTIKVGRRGSLTGNLTIIGKQGHVAYPHLAANPIHLAASAVAELAQQQWDVGDEFFPPTTFQISNIHAGTGAGNVIPGELNILFNFRFGAMSDHHDLQQRVEAILQRHQLHYNLYWRLNGLPFLTSHGRLVDAMRQAIADTVDVNPQLSTTGGTSDGRFIAPHGVEVIEFGPVNKTIHQVNECVLVVELQQLERIFYKVLELVFCEQIK